MFDAKKTPVDPAWAWEPYKPDAKRPWDLRLAGHLFRRAAFGANWSELETAVADGPEKAVGKLLRPDVREVEEFAKTFDGYDTNAARAENTNDLRAWWLRRMISTPCPVLEKMTLFWHNYFGVSGSRVASARLMLDHMRLLRKHALGRFDQMLPEVSHDPATLLALGAESNRKARPSEGFANTLLARFGMGTGNFSEQDASAVAKAFTGWFVVRDQLRFISREHDAGTKDLFGQKGEWNSKDAVRLVLKQPAAPRRVVGELYRWLISETEPPSDALLAPLAKSYAQDFDTGKLLETMLRSNLFFSPVAYRQKVKSPVEFAIGIVRGFEAMVPTVRLGNELATLGQDLYRPPTVKGWAGGTAWINEATLIGRSNLALALVSETGGYAKKLDPLGTAKKHGKSGDPRGFVVDLLLQGDVDPTVRRVLERAGGSSSRDVRQFAHGVLTLPEFQLS
jgi:uncharacterized protein (DUF1800 family)